MILSARSILTPMNLNRRSFLARCAFVALAAAARVARPSLLAEPPIAPPRPAGVLPPEPWQNDGGSLARWQEAARRPIMDSEAPELRPLLSAIRGNRPVRFRYFGGSCFGVDREVTPGLLFTVDGFAGAYLSGYCHTRRAERTFRIERMALGEGTHR
jgi:hypothetical protein